MSSGPAYPRARADTADHVRSLFVDGLMRESYQPQRAHAEGASRLDDGSRGALVELTCSELVYIKSHL